MFSFFHRTPKINLDCFIDNNYVYENVPVVNAHKTYPDWWLNIPNGHKRIFDFDDRLKNQSKKEIMDIVQRNNNMKNCYGFLEFYKLGAVFESWSDFRFKTGLVGYKFYSSNATVNEHGHEQRGMGFSRYHHAKLSNPWILECKEDVSFLLTGATWNLDKYDFIIPPGILNLKLTNMANINLFLPKKADEFEIPIGQPLAHLIPLNDKRVKIHNHLLTNEEYASKATMVTTSFYGWRRKMDLIFKNKEREERKCPFS